MTSSRVAYILTHGPIPDEMFVCHHCDNPPCCNPKHLFLGTPKDNTQDCFKKGRYPIRRGSQVNTSKLTADQVVQIRKEYSEDCRKGKMTELAIKFGIKLSSLQKIIQRKNWSHVA